MSFRFLAFGLVLVLFFGGFEALGIPRKIPGRGPASQPATAEAGPATRPAEPFSPPAEPILRQPSGYVGGSRITRGTPTSDFLPIPDRWRIGVPPESRFTTERGAYGGSGNGVL